MAFRRTLPIAVLLGCAAAALLPSRPAAAWWVRGGGGYPVYVAPPVVVAPPPVAYVRPYPTYARWIPPHWDRRGRWHVGHWG